MHSVNMLSAVMLSVIMLRVVMLSVVMLSVVMLSVIMLSVVMLIVIMLSVITPSAVMLNAVAPQNNARSRAWRPYKPIFALPELTRSQALNQADAVEKLRQAVADAVAPPNVHVETEEVDYPNRKARIRHQCRKTTVFSCHRCLINASVENINNI